MKKQIIFFISILILFSCHRINEPSITETSYIITIENNSGYNIDMRLFGKTIIEGSIKNNEKIVFRFSYPSNVEDSISLELPPPPDFQEADSIRITYNNEVTIFHTKKEVQLVSKSLQLKLSYVGGKTTSTEYEFTYTFTPEDYEEALEFGD